MTVVSRLIMLLMVTLLLADWQNTFRFSGVNTVIYVKIPTWIMDYKHRTILKYFIVLPGPLWILLTRTLDPTNQFITRSNEQKLNITGLVIVKPNNDSIQSHEMVDPGGVEERSLGEATGQSVRDSNQQPCSVCQGFEPATPQCLSGIQTSNPAVFVRDSN